MLKSLRSELASALTDVESQLDAIGGSASTKSFVTNKSGMFALPIAIHVERQ